MPRATLNAEQQAAADEAFEEFDVSDDEVLDAEDDGGEGVPAGDEALDDEGEGEGAEGAEEGEGAEGAAAETDEGAEGAEGAAREGAEAEPEARGDQTIRRQDGAVWNTSANRWVKDGQFVAGEPPKAAGAAAAADAGKAAATPQWQRATVLVDKRPVPIPGDAIVTEQNGHKILAIKNENWPTFQQALSKAETATRVWRQLNDAVREFEENKKRETEGPKLETVEQVEAKVFLDYLNESVTLEDGTKVKRLALAVGDPREITWLKDKAKALHLQAEKDHATALADYDRKAKETREAEIAQQTEPEVQLKNMAGLVLDLVEQRPEFADATQDEVKAMYQALLPFRRSIAWKEGGEWFGDQQAAFNMMTSTLAKLRGTAATTSTPPKKGGTTGTATDSASTRRADRLNRGSAAQSTNLRERRKATLAAKASTTAARSEADAPTPRKGKTREQEAEDKYRHTTNKWLNSDSLDIDDAEDDS